MSDFSLPYAPGANIAEWEEDDALERFYMLLEPPTWHAQAKCKGKTALFYPARGDFKEIPTRPTISQEYQARRLCATCPVRQQCLEVGMREVHGIWGGLSGRERRKIRKARQAMA